MHQIVDFGSALASYTQRISLAALHDVDVQVAKARRNKPPLDF